MLVGAVGDRESCCPELVVLSTGAAVYDPLAKTGYRQTILDELALENDSTTV